MLTADQDRELERRLTCYRRGYYTLEEAERLFAQLARPGNLGELLSRTPPVFVEALRQAADRFRPVRAVGYWKSTLGPSKGLVDRFPHAADLVTTGWLSDERDRIISYLQTGRTYAEWRGFSHCRFGCGAESRALGSRCLTDGEWVWPEGLAPYVESHEVRLPRKSSQTRCGGIAGRLAWQGGRTDCRRKVGARLHVFGWHGSATHRR